MPTPARQLRRMGAWGLMVFAVPGALIGLGSIIGNLGRMHTHDGLDQVLGGSFFLLFSIGLFAGVAYLWRRSGNPASGELLPGSRDFLKHPYFPSLRPRRSPSGRLILPRVVSRPFAILGPLLFGAVFLGVGLVVLLLSITSDSRGGALATLVIGVIFSLVGLGVMGGGIHGILRVLLVGRTRVEIDREPLSPGGRLRVELWQPGSFPITRAEIRLVGREMARWSESSGSSRSSRRIIREHRFADETIAMSRDLAASNSMAILSGEATIPRDAMHSFKSRPCSIEWGIEVRLVIPRRPDVRELYGFRVTPTPPR